MLHVPNLLLLALVHSTIKKQQIRVLSSQVPSFSHHFVPQWPGDQAFVTVCWHCCCCCCYCNHLPALHAHGLILSAQSYSVCHGREPSTGSPKVLRANINTLKWPFRRSWLPHDEWRTHQLLFPASSMIPQLNSNAVAKLCYSVLWSIPFSSLLMCWAGTPCSFCCCYIRSDSFSLSAGDFCDAFSDLTLLSPVNSSGFTPVHTRTPTSRLYIPLFSGITPQQFRHPSLERAFPWYISTTWCVWICISYS